MDWAVLLMAYGGPDSLDDVEPYLLDVRGGRETPAALVEEIRERYAKIGGRSPLLEITCQQGEALERMLNEHGSGRYQVFVGMRHWKPYIHQAVEEIRRAGHRRIVALCMAPYYSRMSIGAYAEKLRKAVEETQENGAAALEIRLVEAWNENPRYVQSLAAKVQAALERFPADRRGSVRVIFTAHSLPAAIMAQGDPYASQFERTACLVAETAGLSQDRWQTAFQSAGASSARWLGPSLEETLETLAGQGLHNVLVAPIGFVADHVEILYDIDMEARELAERLGMRLERIESPNVSPDFIHALADIIEQKVKE